MMWSCPRRAATAVTPAERLEVLFEELAELAGQRNAIDGRIVEIVAEMDRDELCGATGARSVRGVGGLEAGLLLGQRQGDHHRRAPQRGLPPLRQENCGRVGCHWIRSVSSPHGPPTDLMSTTPSWLRSPRSTSCAPRSSSNRAPTLIPGPDPQPLDHQDLPMSSSRWWRITLPHDEAAKFDAALASHSRGVDHRVETATTARRLGERAADAQRPWMRSCVWSRPAGTPKPPAARTASTPPWWSTSMSRQRAAALHLGPLLVRGRTPIPDL